MTPTPEQIAAMEARGWAFDAEVGNFYAHVVVRKPPTPNTQVPLLPRSKR